MRNVLILAALACCACSGDPRPPLVASDVEITEPMPGRNMSAGFMTLTNNSDTDIVVSRAASADYESVEIHESRVEDGIARMRRMPELVIPAASSVVLERGGLHLMMMRASGDPDSVTVDLYGEETLLLSIDADVRRWKN